jgi:acetyl esterase
VTAVQNNPQLPDRNPLQRAVRPVRDYFRRRLDSADQEDLNRQAQLRATFDAEFRTDSSVLVLRRLFDSLADIANIGLPPLQQLVTGIQIDPASPATIDVLVPTGPGPHPVLVYFHGGAWVAGNPASHRKLTARLAQTGHLVISVDYRLAPEHPFPAGLKDCIAAVRWAEDHAEQYHGDPARLAIGGDSAGANLAAATALSLRASLGAPKISALLLIYGVFDMSDMGNESANRFLHKAYLPESLADQLADPRVSPIHAAHKLPPSFVVVGTQDVLLEQSRELCRRLKLAGTRHVYLEERGMPHGFMQMEFLGRVRGVISQMTDFLNDELASRPATAWRRRRIRWWQQLRLTIQRVLNRRRLRGRLSMLRNQ